MDLAAVQALPAHGAGHHLRGAGHRRHRGAVPASGRPMGRARWLKRSARTTPPGGCTCRNPRRWPTFAGALWEPYLRKLAAIMGAHPRPHPAGMPAVGTAPGQHPNGGGGRTRAARTAATLAKPWPPIGAPTSAPTSGNGARACVSCGTPSLACAPPPVASACSRANAGGRASARIRAGSGSATGGGSSPGSNRQSGGSGPHCQHAPRRSRVTEITSRSTLLVGPALGALSGGERLLDGGGGFLRHPPAPDMGVLA